MAGHLHVLLFFAITDQGGCLFEVGTYSRWNLFEVGRLFEVCTYLRMTLNIQGGCLFEVEHLFLVGTYSR